MDDLDRLHRRLVHNIRMTRPEYLKIPFTVRELYEQLVPYRHNRRELAIETNDDYETAVARLLSGERGYVQSEPAMQDALRKELESPTGDPGAFKDYGDTTITLAPVSEAIHTPVPGIAQAAMASPGPAHAPTTSASDATPASIPIERVAPASDRAEERPSDRVHAAYDAMAPAAAIPSAPVTPVPTLLSSLSQIDVPTGCRFCGGTLPEGREANFCPHCGENLRTKRCPACGTEMDTSWNFCVSCGRRGS